RRRGLVAATAVFSARQRWFVLGAWICGVVILGLLVGRFGGAYVDNFTLPGAPSQKAQDVLQQRFPAQAGDSANLVVYAAAGVQSPATGPRFQQLLTQARTLPGVTSVSPPLLSKDGRYAYVVLQYDHQASSVPDSSVLALERLADGAGGKGLQVEVGGTVVSAHEGSGHDPYETVGLVAAVLILLLVFGSFLAMGLPLLSALVGLGTGLLLVGLAARLAQFSTITPSFVAMIGLGIGIDYALFVITRHRQALAAGAGVEDAIAAAAESSGKAVLTAGSLVVIALMGLYVIGIPFIGNLGAAAAIVVAANLLVALTLLPAVLGLLGRNLDRWRIQRLYHDGSARDTERGLAHRLSQQIQRRAWIWALVGTAIPLFLAVPLLHMQLGFSDDGTKPESFHSRRAYDLTVAGFGPGFVSPLVVVVERGGPLDQPAMQRLQTGMAGTPGVALVAPPTASPDGKAAVFRVVPTTGPSDPRTATLVQRLRDSVIPPVVAGTGMQAFVGGGTASLVDIVSQTQTRMPLFFAIVIGLSSLLLMTVFRSIAIPVTAAVMNLLSVGASYGVLVAVFQWGWGTRLIGLDTTGPIEAYLPVILFAILFGLSTDYEVFLLSQVQERHQAGQPTHAAVSGGLAATMRVIGAAAAIMATVFLAFLANNSRPIKEFGLGLAAAVFVDAIVIRLVLVPAAMQLLGEWNWWMPRWLDRLLPRLDLESKPASAPLSPERAPGAARPRRRAREARTRARAPGLEDESRK
ncbi:MAG: MMPL family transporter, partial [Candidatus Dormibacteraeota bacterium]|nr:MMPL family transporter [Candidatus Dormibacteraeota bacterium]